MLLLTVGGKNYRSYGSVFVDKDYGKSLAISNVRADPQSAFAGDTSRYSLEIPVSVRLSPGDGIEFQFPNGFDVTNAAFDSGALSNYLSGTLASSPKYVVSTDAVARKIVLTLTGSFYPNAIDTLFAGIQGLRNPTASGSYIVDVFTKNSLGQTVETLKSYPVFIKDVPV